MKKIKLTKAQKEEQSKKIKLIIDDIKSNKEYLKCFDNVSKEGGLWTKERITNYKVEGKK